MQEARKRRVLHVDDDAILLLLVRATLGKQYEVASFDNLSAAKEASRREHFDIFVCDTQIHDEDGSKWAKELHDAGKKVVTFASAGCDGVPIVQKGDGGVQALLRMLQTL